MKTRIFLNTLLASASLFIESTFKDSPFIYAEKLDAYFWNLKDLDKLIPIDRFIDELPDTFYLNDIEEMLRDLLESAGISRPTVEKIKSLLQNYSFYLYGDLISKYKFTISHVLLFLFQHSIIAFLGFFKLF